MRAHGCFSPHATTGPPRGRLALSLSLFFFFKPRFSSCQIFPAKFMLLLLLLSFFFLNFV
jgi:hypothetical protein